MLLFDGGDGGGGGGDGDDDSGGGVAIVVYLYGNYRSVRVVSACGQCVCIHTDPINQQRGT